MVSYRPTLRILMLELTVAAAAEHICLLCCAAGVSF